MEHEHERIAVAAYEFWKYRTERGIVGNQDADWFTAEGILKHGWRWIAITDVQVKDGVVVGYRLDVPDAPGWCVWTGTR